MKLRLVQSKRRSSHEFYSVQLEKAKNADLGEILRLPKIIQFGDLSVEIAYMKRVSNEILKGAVDLTKSNMKEIYERSHWVNESTGSIGWDSKAKRRELSEKGVRWLVCLSPACAEGHERTVPRDVHSSSHHESSLHEAAEFQLVGFLSFVLTTDFCGQKLPEIYVTEVQVTEKLRGKGLGTQLMRYIIQLATTFEFRVKLTVQTANVAALDWYTSKLGFQLNHIGDSFKELIWHPACDPQTKRL